jgi:predicted phosphate transport protein (TIGR00153 family)
MSFLQGLLPREEVFFQSFARQADLLVQASAKFRAMMEDYGRASAYILEIKELEHQGDIATHEIFDRLNKSFLTPFDPEDIHALASAMDDVLDELEGVAARFAMFHVEATTPEALQLAKILEACSIAIREAINQLPRVRKDGRAAIMPHLIEVNKRENEADDLTRKVVSDLFDGKMAVLDVVKWKEIYTRLEHATDRAEDVTNILENICVKNA